MRGRFLGRQWLLPLMAPMLVLSQIFTRIRTDGIRRKLHPNFTQEEFEKRKSY
jgi:hypothetical protein